jgi:prepilin-type N-terminal cleavage/methylation domain-containing protein
MIKKYRAFTLIELLVVIAIVGILSGFIFVSMNSAITASKDAKRKADISAIAKAISMYSAQNAGALPSTGTSCDVCSNGCAGACANLYTNISPYLTSVPTDPNGATVYYKYTYSATLPSFTLQATLSSGYAYQFDSSTDRFSTIAYSSTCSLASVINVVTCAPITISPTEEACRCVYVGGNGTTNWTVPNGVTSVQYLVVAGGGAGVNSGASVGGGGGGAGGYRSSVSGELSGGGAAAESPLGVSIGDVLAIIVGKGSDANNYNSGNSQFASIIATGGGSGASCYSSGPGYSGGSGGGSSGSNMAAGNGISGQGSDGGRGAGTFGQAATGGGGGGGAGAVGGAASGASSPGSGGAGVVSNITGIDVTYARGGDGNTYNGGAGASGTNERGNGGNGGGGGGSSGGAGGSGVVIFRYIHP